MEALKTQVELLLDIKEDLMSDNEKYLEEIDQLTEQNAKFAAALEQISPDLISPLGKINESLLHEIQTLVSKIKDPEFYDIQLLEREVQSRKKEIEKLEEEQQIHAKEQESVVIGQQMMSAQLKQQLEQDDELIGRLSEQLGQYTKELYQIEHYEPTWFENRRFEIERLFHENAIMSKCFETFQKKYTDLLSAVTKIVTVYEIEEDNLAKSEQQFISDYAAIRRDLKLYCDRERLDIETLEQNYVNMQQQLREIEECRQSNERLAFSFDKYSPEVRVAEFNAKLDEMNEVKKQLAQELSSEEKSMEICSGKLNNVIISCIKQGVMDV